MNFSLTQTYQAVCHQRLPRQVVRRLGWHEALPKERQAVEQEDCKWHSCGDDKPWGFPTELHPADCSHSKGGCTSVVSMQTLMCMYAHTHTRVCISLFLFMHITSKCKTISVSHHEQTKHLDIVNLALQFSTLTLLYNSIMLAVKHFNQFLFRSDSML